MKPPLELKLVCEKTPGHFYDPEDLPMSGFDVWYRTEPHIYGNKHFMGLEILCSDDQDDFSIGFYNKNEDEYYQDIDVLLELINKMRGNRHSRKYNVLSINYSEVAREGMN